MNQTDLIKRGWQMTWRFRVLWVFGILLALVSGGGGGEVQFNSCNVAPAQECPGVHNGERGQENDAIQHDGEETVAERSEVE